MPRPDALAGEITVKSLEDADVVLAEIAWLTSEQSRLDALAKQKIDAIKTDFQAKAVVEIDGTWLSIDERIAALNEPLKKWVEKNIARHLSGKKKSVDLPHGTLGLRQQPLVIEIGKTTTPAKILEQLDEQCGIVASVYAWLGRKLSILGCAVRDVLAVNVTLNLAAVKKAFEEKRLDREKIEALGLVIRDAADEAVIKPAKTVVSAE